MSSTVFDGCDPYVQWRLGHGATDPVARRPLLLRLADNVNADMLSNVDWVDTVPDFYKHPVLLRLRDARWCTAFSDRDQQIPTSTADLQHLVSRLSVLPPIEPNGESADALERRSADPRPYADDGTVVMGVIDYGIGFAHQRFRRSVDETRIEYLWVQDAPDQPSQPGLRDAAAKFVAPVQGINPVPYGREVTARQIDLLLATHLTGGTVDEEMLYRRAGGPLGRRWLRSVSRRVAHGTHVMDLACGYDLGDDDRLKRPIVCVQLPEATTADTSGENLGSYALDGVRYILERAHEIARRSGREYLPVVINFSFGDVAGPHDGTSDLELAIDELIEACRPHLHVVIPAGNSHLRRLHASFTLPAADDRTQPGTQELHWRVLPDDRTPSFIEIWLPEGQDASGLELKLKAPGHEVVGPLLAASGKVVPVRDRDGKVSAEAHYRYVGQPTNRGMFLIAVQPTRQKEGVGNPIAPSGVWSVTLLNHGNKRVASVEAWIQRDDTPYGFPRRGRQSYFDEACYQRYDANGRLIAEDDRQPDCIIKRAGSMNAMATGKETVVIGGYREDTGKPAFYSAGGGPGKVREPDALAVSDKSEVLSGVLAAGTRSGSVVALNGTSVAAPQIARRLADELAEGRTGSGRALVQKLAQDDEQHAITPPPRGDRGGHGRIKRSDDEKQERRRGRSRRRQPPPGRGRR